jgi:hypothetical protein
LGFEPDMMEVSLSRKRWWRWEEKGLRTPQDQSYNISGLDPEPMFQSKKES